ncbi:hypothetical protein D6779_10795 [Candidatus Parcubacteria bacterium]|nr:MAG: hypothetical protein D6779_10795 [Candidatus Parcubacteria bacterium]
MDELRIPGGRVYYGKNYKDGVGMRVGKDFFVALSKKSFQNMWNYFRSMKKSEHLFMYGEKQDASFLMPALFDVCDSAAMCEASINRKKLPRAVREDESGNGKGWVDYWCYYRNMPFVIEAKHVFFSMTERGGMSAQKWDAAIEQLKGISVKEISGQGECLSLALMVVVYWHRGREESNPDVRVSLEELHEQCLENLRSKSKFKGKQPNIWSYWIVPEDSRYIEMTEESYPAVGFIGRLEYRTA